MRQHVPQNTGTVFATKAYYVQHTQMCKISLTFIYLFYCLKQVKTLHSMFFSLLAGLEQIQT